MKHMCATWFTFLSILMLVMGEKWDQYNDPVIEGKLIYQFSELPLHGKTSSMPWSGSYWPNFQSGIAHRWFAKNPENWKYKLYPKKELLSMPMEIRKTLSPAEKYDIYQRRYDYPTVKSEWKRTNPTDEEWFGLCDGWASASTRFYEPIAITVKNVDGVVIPFGSSDIKALLSYYLASYKMESYNTFIGRRCNHNIRENIELEKVSECADVNAGSMHVIISNLLDGGKIGFVGDIDRGYPVWNQPYYSFNTNIVDTKNTSMVRLYK
eukprot:TRINITY_DN4763_c0_g1_i2.p1 TRINITY_DN4763_c0_g1~~TRINITY_DN4763_c0_g1_i2.p1  ORF type:complete len:266 (+),score=50.47 TRINITY_DN4763_c0_g1_i2:95-892(+)